MRGKKYTNNEITLCTYIALHEEGLITKETISRLENRSVASIKMKIQNIVDMLDRKGVSRNTTETPLSGMPPKQSGRWTNWDIVEPLCKLSKSELYLKSIKILDSIE